MIPMNSGVKSGDLHELQAAHSRALRERAAAIAELSALLFNRPHIHDDFRGSSPFVRLVHWTAQARALESRIEEARAIDGEANDRTAVDMKTR